MKSHRIDYSPLIAVLPKVPLLHENFPHLVLDITFMYLRLHPQQDQAANQREQCRFTEVVQKNVHAAHKMSILLRKRSALDESVAPNHDGSTTHSRFVLHSSRITIPVSIARIVDENWIHLPYRNIKERSIVNRAIRKTLAPMV